MNVALIVIIALVVIIVGGGALLLGPDIQRYSRIRSLSRGWHK